MTDQGSRRVPVALRTAYEGTGAAWAAGPGPVYDRLAEALVAACPVPLAGRRTLDLGAGTGAASRAIAAAGGHPVGADASRDMLRQDRRARPPAVTADAVALPFPRASFDAVVAAFSITHVPDPAVALREAARVTRPGGPVLASTFGSGVEHPAKAAIEATASRFGWVPPAWYVSLKDDAEPRLRDPTGLRQVAVDAGLVEVAVATVIVDTHIGSPAALAAWRLGMAQYAPFVAGLDGATRDALWEETLLAVGDDPPPLRPTLIVLSGRVG